MSSMSEHNSTNTTRVRSTSQLAARGGAITLIAQAGKLTAQMASLFVLSRLLTPAEFGIVAMAMVFVVLGERLRDVGISTASLQAPALTKHQASNLFWVNTALGGGIGVLLVASAPLIALLYHETQLLRILPLLAITMLLNGAQVQVQVQLARNHQFAAIALTDLASQVIGVLVAMVSAIAGAGHWALIFQSLTVAFVALVSRLVAARWRPLMPRKNHGTRPIIRSGLQFGGGQLLTYSASNVDTLSIGWRFDASILGYYNRAFQLFALPSRSLLSPLMPIVIPMVRQSAAAGRSPELALSRIQGIVGLVLVWVFMAAAASAGSLLPLVLGSQWQASVPLFQIMAVGGAIQAFEIVGYWAFVYHGLSRQVFLYDLATKAPTIVAVIACSFISAEAVAWAISISTAAAWPISLFWLSKATGRNTGLFLRPALMTIFAGATGFLAAWASSDSIEQFAPIYQVLTQTTIGTVVYMGIMACFPSGRSILREAVKAIKNVAAGKVGI